MTKDDIRALRTLEISSKGLMNIRYLSQTLSLDSNTDTSKILYDDTLELLFCFSLSSSMGKTGRWLLRCLPYNQIDGYEIISDKDSLISNITNKINANTDSLNIGNYLGEAITPENLATFVNSSRVKQVPKPNDRYNDQNIPTETLY